MLKTIESAVLTWDERRIETTRIFALVAASSDEDLRHRLVNEAIVVNLGVAQAIARRFRGRGIPDDDLEQVAFTALVRAAHKFDLSQGRDFLTYAVPTMSGELKRHFRDHGWTVRPPRRIQEIQSRVVHAYKTGHEAGRFPSAARLAEELDLPESDVKEALTITGCFTPTSLDAALGGVRGDMTLGELLVSDDARETQALEDRLVLSSVLGCLGERDRQILHWRFVERRTQVDIGQELGVSQMQVSRLLDRIYRDLRSLIDDVVTVAA